MKKFIKLILVSLIIVMNLNFTACNNGSILNEILGGVNSDYVVLDGEDIKKDEILAYESPYKDACTTYYKDTLSGEELELYKIFLYAYEHGNTSIGYYSSNENLGDSYDKVLQCLSAENPFIDWNQQYSYTSLSDCYKFENSQLDKKDIELKVEAYNKAKTLVQSIPANSSSYDKLLWIYNYVTNNVKYVDDVNSYLEGSPYFIYDALIKGKTQCSGFADTVTMMCNLSGIQSITVCGETSEGHAWNLVNLDGDFYYCDPTSDSVIKEDLPEWGKGLNLSFLKSEEIFSSNGYKMDDETVIEFPKALNKKYDDKYIDFNLKNLSNNDELTTIAKKMMKENKYVVIHLQETSALDQDKCNKAMQYILDYICNNMTSSEYNYVSINNFISEGSNDLVLFASYEK